MLDVQMQTSRTMSLPPLSLACSLGVLVGVSTLVGGGNSNPANPDLDFLTHLSQRDHRTLHESRVAPSLNHWFDDSSKSPINSNCTGKGHCGWSGGCGWAGFSTCGRNVGTECYCRCCCPYLKGGSCTWAGLGTFNRANPGKFYIYDLPARMNIGIKPRFSGVNQWFRNELWEVHTEVRMHAILNGSSSRTLNPVEAALFVVPAYPVSFCSATRRLCLNRRGGSSCPHLPELEVRYGCEVGKRVLLNAMKYVRMKFPFWDRHGGADHVFMALR